MEYLKTDALTFDPRSRMSKIFVDRFYEHGLKRATSHTHPLFEKSGAKTLVERAQSARLLPPDEIAKQFPKI